MNSNTQVAQLVERLTGRVRMVKLGLQVKLKLALYHRNPGD